jgi:hypothetical protein
MQIQNRTSILRGPRGFGAACAFFVLSAVLCAVVANVSLAGAAVAAGGAGDAGAPAVAQSDAAASVLAAAGVGAGAEVARLQLEAVADAAFADGPDDASDTFGMVANFGANNCQNGRWEAHFSVLESSVGALGAGAGSGAGGASADGGSDASSGLGLGASASAGICVSAGGVLALDESAGAGTGTAGATGGGQGAFVCYLVNTSGAGVAYSVTLTSSVGAGAGAAAGSAGSVPVEVNLLVGEAARAYIDGTGAAAGDAAVGGAAAGDAAKSAADLQQCLPAGGVELPCGIAALEGTGAVIEGQLGDSSDANEVPVVVTWSLSDASGNKNNAATQGTFDDVAVSLSLCVQGAPAALSAATDGNSPSTNAPELPAGAAPGTSTVPDVQPSGAADNTEIHDVEGVTGNTNLATSDAPNDSAHQGKDANVDAGDDDGTGANVGENAPEQVAAALASTGDAAVKTVAVLCALAVICVAAVCYVLLKA